MKLVYKKESFNPGVVLIIDLLLEEIAAIPKQEVYSSMQLTHCPVCCFDMRHEVSIRLAKNLANHIYRTSVKFNFEFKVEEGKSYIYNGSKYLEISNNLLLHFIYSAFDRSELPTQYRRKTVMEKASILFKKLVISQ